MKSEGRVKDAVLQAIIGIKHTLNPIYSICPPICPVVNLGATKKLFHIIRSKEVFTLIVCM